MNSLVSDVPQRLLTICVGVPILWMLWSFPRTRHLFFQGTHVVMCWEWTLLSKMKGVLRPLFVIASLCLANLPNEDHFRVALLLSAAIFPFLAGSVDPSVILSSTAGLLLISYPNRVWLMVSQDFQSTVSLLFTVWNADTGALIAGRLGTLCKTNLPRPSWLRTISPAKSVEGLLGGLLGGTLTYFFLPWFWAIIPFQGIAPLHEIYTFWSTSAIHERLKFGLVLSLAAIGGDLWESSLKRAFKVKDSGKLLPGHGGVLDRFDSSLLAVVVYYYVLSK